MLTDRSAGVRHPKRPMFTDNRPYDTNRAGLFSFFSVITQIIIIAVVYAAYYYIKTNDYFPLWLIYIHWAVKIIIAFEIVIAAARSLTVPLLAMILGGVALYLMQTRDVSLITGRDAWELIIMGAAGFVITFIVRSLRRQG